MAVKLKNALTFLRDNKKKVRTAMIAILVIIAVAVFGGKGKSDTITMEEANSDMSYSEEGDNVSSKIFVDIGGEVKSPGVYEVSSDSRIFEVIEQAGGLTDDADTSNVNRAETVSDGQKINIPSKLEYGASESPSGTGSAGGSISNALININTASSEELQKIAGVGPSTAQKIIDYRSTNGRFKSKDEIKNVSGIGDKTYAKMEDKITV